MFKHGAPCCRLLVIRNASCTQSAVDMVGMGDAVPCRLLLLAWLVFSSASGSIASPAEEGPAASPILSMVLSMLSWWLALPSNM